MILGGLCRLPKTNTKPKPKSTPSKYTYPCLVCRQLLDAQYMAWAMRERGNVGVSVLCPNCRWPHYITLDHTGERVLVAERPKDKGLVREWRSRKE